MRTDLFIRFVILVNFHLIFSVFGFWFFLLWRERRVVNRVILSRPGWFYLIILVYLVVHILHRDFRGRLCAFEFRHGG